MLHNTSTKWQRPDFSCFLSRLIGARQIWQAPITSGEWAVAIRLTLVQKPEFGRR